MIMMLVQLILVVLKMVACTIPFLVMIITNVLLILVIPIPDVLTHRLFATIMMLVQQISVVL